MAAPHLLVCVTRRQRYAGRGRSYLLACMLGPLLWGLSPLVWEHNIGAEVFALNNLLVAALVSPY
jgi:hypothetical protein